jgi:Cu(I)/Ag(I) efflux system membrane protein CusA/SilA
VLQYLNSATGRLPPNVTPQLGPDAAGVGWVYQYVALAKNRTLAELRALQDWYLRYQLNTALGVSEVASVGGFVQQYQVVVDPARLRAYGFTLDRIAQVIRSSNRDVGAAWSRWPRPNTWCVGAVTCAARATSRTWC